MIDRATPTLVDRVEHGDVHQPPSSQHRHGAADGDPMLLRPSCSAITLQCLHCSFSPSKHAFPPNPPTPPPPPAPPTPTPPRNLPPGTSTMCARSTPTSTTAPACTRSTCCASSRASSGRSQMRWSSSGGGAGEHGVSDPGGHGVSGGQGMPNPPPQLCVCVGGVFWGPEDRKACVCWRRGRRLFMCARVG